MKAVKTILPIILILVSFLSVGQGLEASTYIERTVVSPKLGTSIGYVFDNNFEVGGFYQQSAEGISSEQPKPFLYEKEMYGAFVACPLVASRKANLKLNIRTGVSNGENFVITPSFQGNFQAARMVTLGAGVGVRALRPTMMASLKINI
jgi:hypothetical protein